MNIKDNIEQLFSEIGNCEEMSECLLNVSFKGCNHQVILTICDADSGNYIEQAEELAPNAFIIDGELKVKRFETKNENGRIRVFDTKDKTYITNDVPTIEIANEIRDDFNRFESMSLAKKKKKPN